MNPHRPLLRALLALLFVTLGACLSSSDMDRSYDEADDGGHGGDGGGHGGDENAAGAAGDPDGGDGGDQGTSGGTTGIGGLGGVGGSKEGGAVAGGQGGAMAKMLLPCGDIQPNLDHEPFEAIKRLKEGRDEVRILVYGQSISEQEWWKETRDWLRKTYPQGKLIMESHARGGCAAQCLIGESSWFFDGKTENRLPGDVYAWKPDLILFHVYGSHTSYEKIVKGFKDNTSAEVLLQTDHRTKDDPMATKGEAWSQTMSTRHVPGYATKYGFALARIWEAWWEHMQAVNQPARFFLADNVHLNAEGNKLMAMLIKPHLCYQPNAP